MTAISQVAADSATMLRRNLRHALRYPSLTVSSIITPILFLLLFVGVFGKALGKGVGGVDYIDYVTPGIILMAVASGCMAPSVAVAVDMTEGVIARFRTMPIARSSLLTGHVVGSMMQTLISLVLSVLAAVAMGYRPDAGLGGWLGAAGLMVLLTFALTWFAVALGLLAKGPEGASNSPLIIQFLPLLGSAIVPPDSMPAGVRWFAQYQPFTPMIEAMRRLLTGQPAGHDAAVSVAWCAGVAVVGYVWSKWLFNRGPSR
ncbi:ABC transporter permease [Actinomadura sp. LD22]|uniref:Transport permease protein n=1 Tax=Actinomadura physcomitrii TaxID=2650748 RepID=A0A6I4M7E1_9ACTN|nr:ABC transporter permease [Actinomadura physcomitrii]MWA02078.1 ABC transporter permease [Actinomadura physcomitrii]